MNLISIAESGLDQHFALCGMPALEDIGAKFSITSGSFSNRSRNLRNPFDNEILIGSNVIALGKSQPGKERRRGKERERNCTQSPGSFDQLSPSLGRTNLQMFV